MLHFRLLTLIAIAVVSCTAAALDAPQQDNPPRELTREMKARAIGASFEVVVPKPDESSITYEKDPPWDLIPFHLRNDKYYSIGTAFAVSRTELVTAFHVIDLASMSLSFPRLYIRDSAGAVFEIDQITGSDQQRDVVRFTVKNRAFATWLDLNPAFELNQVVFSVGNALGEGNVIRRGDLIGTVKEPVDGRWDLLKSSADVNGGNSGGPLLDQQGKVIGVVVQRNDNISLSLPVAELKSLSKATASFFAKAIMTFPIIPEQSAPVTLRFELPVPSPYQNLRTAAVERFGAFNDGEMSAFLERQSPDLFPAGAPSQEAILGNRGSSYTEIYLKSPETRVWSLSDLKTRESDLGNNGKIFVSPLSENFILGRVRLPDGMPMDELFKTPKTFMDMLYKGLEITRPFGPQRIRISSMGEPFRQAMLQDRWGRRWFQSVWLNPLGDLVDIAYLTAVPGGAAYMLREVPSPRARAVEFDDKRLLDFVQVPYAGRLKDWQQLMKRRDLLPASFEGVTLESEPGRFLRLESPWIAIDLQHKDWPIEENGWLNLGMGFNVRGSQVTWGLRRLQVEQYENNEYFTVLKHLKPFPGMDDYWENGWNTVTRSLHPYNGKVFSDEGNSAIAKQLPGPEGGVAGSNSRFTLYWSTPGTVSSAKAKRALDMLGAAITARGDEDSTAAGQPVAASGE